MRERERERERGRGTVHNYNYSNHKHNIDTVSKNSNIYEILDCIQYKEWEEEIVDMVEISVNCWWETKLNMLGN